MLLVNRRTYILYIVQNGFDKERFFKHKKYLNLRLSLSLAKTNQKRPTKYPFFPLGYYADPEMGCQAYHVCQVFDDGFNEPIKNSFLCPNGTIFNQPIFTCDWW